MILDFIKKNLYKIPGLQEFYIQIRFHMRYKKHIPMINKSPENFIRYIYKSYLGKEINLINPESLSEKLNWLKLYHYDEKAVKCADKYKVRDYVKEKGLGFLLNDLIGVYDNVNDIDFGKLPDSFVFKANHGSGMNIIIKDKKRLNIRKAKKIMRNWLKYNYGYMSGEWVYRDIEPKIICERFLGGNNHEELLDCKVLCFNGNPELFKVNDCSINSNSVFYDLEGKVLPFTNFGQTNDNIDYKPIITKEMIEYAKILADDFPFVRIDFYLLGEKVYFGEMTFFHAGGFKKFNPSYVDYDLGKKLKLPPKKDAWGK